MSSSPDKTTPEGGRQEFKLPQKGNKDPHSSLLPWRRIILAKSRLRGLSWELEPGLLFHVSCYCPFSERESTNISPSGRSAPCVGDTNGIYFCDPHYLVNTNSSNVPHLTRYDKKRQMLPLHTHIMHKRQYSPCCCCGEVDLRADCCCYWQVMRPGWGQNTRPLCGSEARHYTKSGICQYPRTSIIKF